LTRAFHARISVVPGYLEEPGDTRKIQRVNRVARRRRTLSPEGILVWQLDPAVHARAACEIAGRELTEVGWRTCFGDDPQVETCRQLIP
jgi:hypothetical protein